MFRTEVESAWIDLEYGEARKLFFILSLEADCRRLVYHSKSSDKEE